jgi:pimeloyl-ACP methyl ester carboxylesterase
VIPSKIWLEASGDSFRAKGGTAGWTHLSNYIVDYCEWGEGPPIVVVPGMAGGYDLLGPLARNLAKRHRVISYQLRGETNSFDLRRPFDLDDLVDDLAEFVDWLCLEKPTILGVSFGGVLALEFAARFPYRLQNLVLQGVGARYEGGLLPRVASTVLSRFPLPADNAFVNQFFNLLFGGAQKKDALFDFVTTQVWQTDQSVMAHRLRLIESFNMVERLERVRARTMVLCGSRDILVSRGSLKALHHGIEDAELVMLPGSGHLAFVSHPQAVSREVERFLAC